MTISPTFQVPFLVVFLASLVAAFALSAWPVSAATVNGGSGSSNAPSPLQQMAKGSGVRTVNDEEPEELSEEDVGKRGWNDLSGVWGKRGWNDLQGVWGKRGWNDLQGVWGKKRSWNNLNGMWGKKRGWNDLSGMWGKRSQTNWNNLKGLWGKRSANGDALYMQGPNWQGRAAYVIDDGSMDDGPMDGRQPHLQQLPPWLEH